ncbi:MAG: sugar-binding protein, partial [Armatimonadota bacterium]
GGSRLSAQSSYDLGITVSNPSAAPLDEAVQVEWQDKLVDSTVHLAPREAAHSKQELALPPFRGLSYSFPVRLLGRGGGFGDFDVRWLTVAPAVRADTAKTDTALSWHVLGADSLTIGRSLWLGPKDLSARFAVVVLPETLTFVVEVADNDITVAQSDPHDGDSVELYLDLRRAADQGKPIYGPEVVTVQIPAPSAMAGTVDWRGMQPLPEALKNMKVQGRRTPDGYRVRVELPLAAVTALRGGSWPGLGFDVAVNDADGGGPRKAQMMWTGFPDNYLNPGYLAGLYAEPLPLGATRQTLW